MVLIHHLKPEVIATVRQLIFSQDTLDEYMELVDQEISRGMDKETCEEAAVKSIITHVNKKPTGEEEGQFLGLDFSGPTIKIMLVKLENKECTITQKLYDIPEKYMAGKSERLFRFIAKCLNNFLSGLKLKVSRMPLGVTFGFPIEQTSLQDCKLLRWSKGFQCDDLINKNIFLKLKTAIREFPDLKKVFVIGILNDAVSAVLACAWQDPRCMAGAVIGPGASCCYAEKVYRVSKYDAEHYGIKDIYMNLETSQLGEDGCLDKFRTDFDEELDQQSKNPRKMINEKLISNVYFGELARLILIKCLQDKIILKGQIPEKITLKDGLTLEHLKLIEMEIDPPFVGCTKVLNEFGFQNVTEEDCFQVQFICRCVSRRSANLVAAQLAVIINRINEPQVTIATDGDLIKNYPRYVWYLKRKIRQLKKEECSFQVTIMEENFLGPAILAALFGEEVMNRDEKLRRLPGFPMDKCHFGKKRGCLNPDCNAGLPCGPSANPMESMMTTSQDLLPDTCGRGCGTEKPSLDPCAPETRRESIGRKKSLQEKTEQRNYGANDPLCGEEKKKCRNPCKGYDKL